MKFQSAKSHRIKTYCLEWLRLQQPSEGDFYNEYHRLKHEWLGSINIMENLYVWLRDRLTNGETK